MKHEGLAVVLILLSLVSGMILTAATSGCANNRFHPPTALIEVSR